jgi:NADH:ubiquinone oxidoreductase subunit K
VLLPFLIVVSRGMRVHIREQPALFLLLLGGIAIKLIKMKSHLLITLLTLEAIMLINLALLSSLAAFAGSPILVFVFFTLMVAEACVGLRVLILTARTHRTSSMRVV